MTKTDGMDAILFFMIEFGDMSMAVLNSSKLNS